jgi:hypothetical protein
MRWTAAPILLTALAGAARPALSKDIAEHMGRLRPMDPALDAKGIKRPDACSEPDTREFWTVLAGISGEAEYAHTLRGKASLGYQGDDSRPYRAPVGTSDAAPPGEADQYELSAGLELRRGSYPGEFKFDAGVNVRLQRGELEENVRDLFVAYDYWASPWFEPFAFGRQFSDNYLDIDQRYEVGAGAFVGAYLLPSRHRQKLLPLLPDEMPKPCEVDEWKKQLKEAGDRVKSGASLAPGDPSWLRCHAKVLEDPRQAVADLEELIEDLENQWPEAYHGQTQRNARLRLGVALSVFGELEHATIQYMRIDTLSATPPSGTTPLDGESGRGAETVTTRTPVDLPVPATERLRWAIRPTLEFRPSHRWGLSAEWYFKLPLGDTGTAFPGEAEPRYDYRYELDVKGTFSVEEKEIGQPGNVSVEVRYRRFFDNAPPFYQPGNGLDLGPSALIAPDTHTMMNLSLGIRW